MLLVAITGSAQNIQYQVDGENLYYGNGCDDCYSGPDPRWQTRVSHDNANWSDWNVSQEDISCPSWRNVTNYSWRNYTTTGYGSTLYMQFNGYEDDDWTCGGDDYDCGGYGSIGTINITGSGNPHASGITIHGAELVELNTRLNGAIIGNTIIVQPLQHILRLIQLFVSAVQLHFQ
ncbi:MAG: hypothetical protein M0D57_06445 [Sphingobacteriales bacterium JAD_PAG50586_3]|nr:MAG: hypothetical protein M0D57_06445 [Sphingobacteriales bacterium JAD_PAG50586_3]